MPASQSLDIYLIGYTLALDAHITVSDSIQAHLSPLNQHPDHPSLCCQNCVTQLATSSINYCCSCYFFLRFDRRTQTKDYSIAVPLHFTSWYYG